EEAGSFLDRMGFDRAALLGTRGWIDEIVVGLLDAAAGLVHQPAVIAAADAGLLDHAEGKIRAPVRAVPVEQTEAASHVLVQDQVLAEEPHGLDRVAIELARAADRHPVAPQQLPHGGSRPDLGENPVLLVRQHFQASLPPSFRGAAQQREAANPSFETLATLAPQDEASC